MSAPVPAPYFLFPGTAHEALIRYQRVFGGDVEVHTYREFGRIDGPGDAIAHGVLSGPVSVFASDASPDEDAFSSTGLLLALLGAAEPATLHRWFAELASDGTVLDPLQQRPWSAWDGTVRDAFGVTWLIGYETDVSAEPAP